MKRYTNLAQLSKNHVNVFCSMQSTVLLHESAGKGTFDVGVLWPLGLDN